MRPRRRCPDLHHRIDVLKMSMRREHSSPRHYVSDSRHSDRAARAVKGGWRRLRSRRGAANCARSCLGGENEFGSILAIAVAVAMFAAGLLGLASAAQVAGASHKRRFARHDLRGCRPSHASVRSGHRPPDLDGLRRVLQARTRRSRLSREDDAARFGAVRLWSRGHPCAGPDQRGAGKNHRPSLAREPERQQFRRQQFRLGDSEHARSGKAAGGASTPRPTSKSRRSPRRTSMSEASVRRECRCPSRSPRRSSYPVVLIVVGWVACLFCGFGLTSRATMTSVVTLAVGSIAVASAVLLILDLSSPYAGIVPRLARALGAGACGHGQGVRLDGLKAPCPDSSPRSGRERP